MSLFFILRMRKEKLNVFVTYKDPLFTIKSEFCNIYMDLFSLISKTIKRNQRHEYLKIALLMLKDIINISYQSLQTDDWNLILYLKKSMVTNNTFFRHTCPIDLYTLNYINQFYHNTAFIISIELIYTKILL